MALDDLLALARPLSRSAMLARGQLVDTQAAAAFVGFTAPAAVSIAAWEEVVCASDKPIPLEETRAAAMRLKDLWTRAQRAVVAYKASGTVAPIVLFSCPSLAGKPVRVALVCRNELGRPGLTLTLEGEL